MSATESRYARNAIMNVMAGELINQVHDQLYVYGMYT